MRFVFNIGLWGTQDLLVSILDKVFQNFKNIIIIHSSDELDDFLKRTDLGSRILIVGSKPLAKQVTESVNFKDFIDRLDTHLILPESGHSHEIEKHQVSRIHVIDVANTDNSESLAHHLYGIKRSLESYWKWVTRNKILIFFEEIIYDIDPDIKRFIDQVRDLINAESIQVFQLQGTGNKFHKLEGTGTFLLDSLDPAYFKNLLPFMRATATKIVPGRVFLESLKKEGVDSFFQSFVISTIAIDSIPYLAIYPFKEDYEHDLMTEFCGFVSSEIFQLLWTRELQAHYRTLKGLTDIQFLHEDKNEAIWQILFRLKAHFKADGVTLIELIGPVGDRLKFKKTYVHRTRKEIDEFETHRGYAHYCAINKKALLIGKTFKQADPPYAIGLEFDPDRLGTDQGKKVKIDYFLTTKTLEEEDEASLMYYPLRRGNSIFGFLKIGDFLNENSFNLNQLQALAAFSEPVISLLENIHLISKLQMNAEKRATDKKMEEHAEVIFFYREMALRAFHEVTNLIKPTNERLWLAKSLLERKGIRDTELFRIMDNSLEETKTALTRISEIQTRGRDLKPQLQECFLVRDVIRPSYEYAEKRVKDANIKIDRSFTNEDYLVYLDPELAIECIINLLTNAIWAIKENKQTTKKEIFVAVRKIAEKDMVKIEITDSGIGIEPQIFPHLFQRFFTTRPGGTGLGLYFARKIVREFEGEIEMQSIPVKGTTVTITLPLGEQ